MSKDLNLTDSSPTSVKTGDTSTKFSMQLTVDGNSYDISQATAISIVVADSNLKTIQSITVDPTTVDTPEDGVIPVPFNADIMGKLTAGQYNIEAHVTDTNGVNIFPSEGFLSITVNESLGSE
ncbi:hypothetical protein NR224_01130 [Pediococcus ethanolidurans]|uniref:hypothetical protein n=1 Tax=Pediococcus ethanolidurans TaxID=319653 RepID=UPI0021E7C43E|nr:hypothetical protein [Pediococcus ethanolidurans]MCV3320823.1 hypothetical protein [Pediococcus ethanolidurans]